MLQHMLVGPKADALCAAASIIKPIHNVKDVRSKPHYPPNAGSVFISSIGFDILVEPIGIEPMTPCLQSRCSPS